MIVPILPPEEIKLPALACPIIDGVLAFVAGEAVRDSHGNIIPNRQVHRHFYDFEGMVGFLTVGEPTAAGVFGRTVDELMIEDGEPDVRFYVLDLKPSTRPLWQRLGVIADKASGYRIAPLFHVIVNDRRGLVNLDHFYRTQGWEGALIRDPNGACGELGVKISPLID